MKAASQVVVFCWAVAVVFWVVSAFSVKATKERQPFVGRLIYLWIICAAAALLAARRGWFSAPRSVLPHTLPVGVAADAIVLLGLAIAVWARSVLGGNWSSRVTLKENHELIQRGPYRLVRHPIYSGILLMVLGTAVLAGSLGAFLALFLCFGGLWIKLRQEEKLLSKHFPEYAQYQARTKALVPFLL